MIDCSRYSNYRTVLLLVAGVNLTLLVVQIVLYQVLLIEPTTSASHGYAYRGSHIHIESSRWVRWPWPSWAFPFGASLGLWLLLCVDLYGQWLHRAWAPHVSLVWQVVWLLLFAVHTGQPLDQVLVWCGLTLYFGGKHGTGVIDRPHQNGVNPTLASNHHSADSNTATPNCLFTHQEWDRSRFDRSSRYRCSFASLSTDIDWQQELAAITDTETPTDELGLADDLPPPPPVCKPLICDWVHHLHLVLWLLSWGQLVGRWQQWTEPITAGWLLHGLYCLVQHYIGHRWAVLPCLYVLQVVIFLVNNSE
jgi:hypothetical protein